VRLKLLLLGLGCVAFLVCSSGGTLSLGLLIQHLSYTHVVVLPCVNRYNPHAISDFVGRLFLELPDHKIEAQVKSMMNT
jgi:hypothetical protein